MSSAISLIAIAFYSLASVLLARSLGLGALHPHSSRLHRDSSTTASLETASPGSHVRHQTGSTSGHPSRHLSGDLTSNLSGNLSGKPLSRAPGFEQKDKHQNTILGLATAATLLHAWIVVQLTGLPQELSLPLLTSVAATTLTIVLLHILLSLKQPSDYLGLAVYPLAALSLLATQIFGVGQEIIGDAVEIHVFLSLLSYAVLALAAAQAVLVSIQRHFLSRHKPGGFIRSLPPLDTTETLLFTLLGAGFALLSLSLASGFFYLEDMLHQHLVHKTVLSCTGWAIIGVLLFGRWKFGWRGKKAVHWTLAGFAILILAYFGSKLVLEVLLR